MLSLYIMRYFLDKKIDWEKPNYVTRENITRILTCFYIDKLPRSQYLCLQYIFRRTYGHNKTREVITIKHFLEGLQDKNGEHFYSGLNIGRTTLINSLKELHQSGLINRYKVQLSRGFIYEYSLNIEELLNTAGVNTVRNSKKEKTNLPETKNTEPPKAKLKVDQKKFARQGTKIEPCQGTKTEPIKNNKYINIFIKGNNKKKIDFNNFVNTKYKNIKGDYNINSYINKKNNINKNINKNNINKSISISSLNLFKSKNIVTQEPAGSGMADVNVYKTLQKTIEDAYLKFHGVPYVFGAKERSIADRLRDVFTSLGIDTYQEVITFVVEHWNAVLRAKFYWMEDTSAISTFSIGFFLKYINEFMDYYHQKTKLTYFIQGDEIHNYIYKLMRRGVDKDTAIKRASCKHQLQIRDLEKEQDLRNMMNELERDKGEFDYEKHLWQINNEDKLNKLEEEVLALREEKAKHDAKIRRMELSHKSECYRLKQEIKEAKLNTTEGSEELKKINEELKEKVKKLHTRIDNCIELDELKGDSMFVSVPVKEGTRWTTKKVRRERLSNDDLISFLMKRGEKRRSVFRR